MKPGIGSIAERMIEALNCGDIKEFERLKDGSPPPKDERSLHVRPKTLRHISFI